MDGADGDRSSAQGAGDPLLLIDLLIRPRWTRLLITRDPVTHEYVDANVTAVLAAFSVPSARP